MNISSNKTKNYFKNEGPLDYLTINLADQNTIRSWSYGEVKKGETINYRSLQPEKEGLFCAIIFGPIKDYCCLCGKYKNRKYENIKCEKCGVDVTNSLVRRYRFGHIELASFVIHPWLKSSSGILHALLNINRSQMEKIVLYDVAVVTKSNLEQFKVGDLIPLDQVEQLEEQYQDQDLVIKTGGDAIQSLLENLNLTKEIEDVEEKISSSKSLIKNAALSKRLKILKSFHYNQISPSSVCLSVLPVLPPDLRPLVAIDGGRFASSDLNELYKRIINRNNRLKKLITISAPDIIINNEKRMLQEAVDLLFDGPGNNKSMYIGGTSLKSLTENLVGKKGRFRQNLLGKRVDYSGRSVISVGPKLKINECGVPREMLAVLFKPYIYHMLHQRGHVNSIHEAKTIFENRTPLLWTILDEVLDKRPILLNRAPTLHRSSFQAFYPKALHGHSIQINPLVCRAFNADFDGDTMGIYLPLLPKSILEVKSLMMASDSIFSCANGSVLAAPSQEITLGIYYMTCMVEDLKGDGSIFYNAESVKDALFYDKVIVLTRVKLLHQGKFIETNVGRILCWLENTYMPFELFNRQLSRSIISDMIKYCYHNFGHQKTLHFIESFTSLGFKYSTQSGTTATLSDIKSFPNKAQYIADAKAKIMVLTQDYNLGIISESELESQKINIWMNLKQELDNKLKSQVKNQLFDQESKAMNSMYMMIFSGARGSISQLSQLSIMRGLLVKVTGEIMSEPILSSFKEGLSTLEYFFSSHGTRKGLANKALSTASAGYLTRKLVDVCQDVIINNDDCGTDDGINMIALRFNQGIISLSSRIIGRYLAADLVLPNSQIISKNSIISDEDAELIESMGIISVKIRSSITCKLTNGICQKCYGTDLSKPGTIMKIGSAVGIIAAQSIGEPSTQLTMRLFHFGGSASREEDISDIKLAEYDAVVTFENGLEYVPFNLDNEIIVTKPGSILLTTSEGYTEKIEVIRGQVIYSKHNQKITVGDPLLDQCRKNIIVADVAGLIEIKSFSNKDIQEKVTESTKSLGYKILQVVTTSKDYDKQVKIIIKDSQGTIKSTKVIPKGFNILIQDGKEVVPGQILAKGTAIKDSERSNETITKDIVGGLGEIAAVFENRTNPTNTKFINSPCDGIITDIWFQGNRSELHIQEDNTGKNFKIKLPLEDIYNLNKGDHVTKYESFNNQEMSFKDMIKFQDYTDVATKILKKVQSIFVSYGITVNDRHFEIVISKMLSKGYALQNKGFYQQNEVYDIKVLESEGIPYKRDIFGISRISLQHQSFLSACSFQETSKVLCEAIINNKRDNLVGIKENTIVGNNIKTGLIINPYFLDKIS